MKPICTTKNDDNSGPAAKEHPMDASTLPAPTDTATPDLAPRPQSGLRTWLKVMNASLSALEQTVWQAIPLLRP